jgi:hypothetical protein
MIALSFAALIANLNLESHLATRVELTGSPHAGVKKRAFFSAVIEMSWGGDQQSCSWNAAFTKSQVLARTWTARYFQRTKRLSFHKEGT